MILVDTSVWVDHFRNGNVHLQGLLMDGDVLCHPFVIGELACGHLKKRKEIIELLQTLPSAQMAQDEEILQFIEIKKIFGTGLGWVDIHLIASAMLTKTLLWTQDAKLHTLATQLNINYKP